MRSLSRLAAGLVVLAGILQAGLADDGSGIGSGGGTGVTSDAITFVASDFYDYEPQDTEASLFASNLSNPSKEFKFTTKAADIVVTQAQLYDSVTGFVLGISEPSGVSSSFASKVNIVLSVPLSTGAGSITITNTGAIFDANANDHPLYFALSWSQGTSKGGKSYSRTFGFTSVDRISTLLADFTSTQPALAEVPASTATAKTTTKAAGSSSTVVPTIATEPAGTAAQTNAPTAATSTSSAGTAAAPAATSASSTGGLGRTPIKKGGGGISGGAIAGIVVGVVAVLAIVALLAWFLLRRRRARKDNLLPRPAALGAGGRGSGFASRFSSPFSSPSSTYKTSRLLPDGTVEPYRSPYGVPDLGGGDGPPHAEKQAATAIGDGGAVYSSLGSPLGYDDGAGMDSAAGAPAAAGAAGAATRGEAAPAPPASGQAPPPGAVPASARSGPSAAADGPTSQPLVNPLLMEDGMTPEQVARLAAEELALDEAIQKQPVAR